MCQMCELAFVGFAEPQEPMLASFIEALKRGWSPSNVRDVSGELLAEIKRDPAGFLARHRDDAPLGETIRLPDGREVERLPMRTRWIWDGDFCGQISLRWQPGTNALPPHVLGHVGYAIVPWKRGHGIAKRALRHILSEAREVGLSRIEITVDPENVASQKVILANGGRFDRAFVNDAYGPHDRHLYVIELSQ